ncbi:ANTAR domain-containing protein [Streptomyces globosus]|uniref:ANTAR domain-containing protein n=1 Tax=Streptomyces globosus TaxID=68209 RepID=UPI0037F5B169
MPPAEGGGRDRPAPGGGEGPAAAAGARRAAVFRRIMAALERVAPEDVPGRLCTELASMLPARGLAISLLALGGVPGSTWCASDALARRLADLQFTLGDGPGITAAEVFAPVLAPDLSSAREARRWPLFTPPALRAGARAVYSVPLGSSRDVFGTLDLYRDTPGIPAPPELATAVIAADAATQVIGALKRRDGGDVTVWLRPGLTPPEQNEIHQAVDLITAVRGIDVNEALALLRARAFREDRTAAEVAHDVIRGTLRFDTD